ncbi:MAG: hypothetical protein H7A32_03670 [Deltaproteobacteria bacterium]|nr:hypothetical protein [Deltaproteobacteria bacterium]
MEENQNYSQENSHTKEKELIVRCLKGDALAFEKLFSKYRPQLLTYFLIRYADYFEAEDEVQEVLLKAYQSMPEFSSQDVFSQWLLSIASVFSQSKLKDKTPWSPDALEILKEHLMENAANEKLLQEIYQDYQEDFQIIDHVLFCFIVLTKTRFADEQESFVLSELFDFSPEDLTKLESLSEKEGKNVEAQLRETHEDLAEIYAQRCSLIKRDAPCTQCHDMASWLKGDEDAEEQREKLPLHYHEDALDSFDERLDLIRDRVSQKLSSPKFHQKLFDLLRLAIGEKGAEGES